VTTIERIHRQGDLIGFPQFFVGGCVRFSDRLGSVTGEFGELVTDEQSSGTKPGILRQSAGKGMRLIFRILGGIALLLIGFYVLVWAEVDTAIQGAVNLNAGVADDEVLVTFTGRLSFDLAAVDDSLLSPSGQESSQPYAVIQRHVQTCAFMEEAGQEIRYSKRWVSDMDVPDSTRFKQSGYDNIRGVLSSGVTVGKGLTLKDDEDISYRIRTELGQLRILTMGDITPKKADVRGARHVDQQWVYIDRHCSPDKGDIGGQRVRFSVLREGDRITAFGVKQGESIVAHQDDVYLSKGSRDMLIALVRSTNDTNRWMFWCGGGLAIWLGLYITISTALFFVTWIPLLGGLIKGAATAITFCIALALTAGFVFWGWGMDTWLHWFGGLVQ
jgi:hypothetical protein